MRVLILTNYGSVATAVVARKLGAVDYLSKPVDTGQIEAALFAEQEIEVEASREIPMPSLSRVEWQHIQRVLKDCGGNISAAAHKLGILRCTLQEKLGKYPPLT